MIKAKIKIGIMTAWNSDSGVCMHAEPIVKEWLKMGFDVRVFSYLREDQHGLTTKEKDEPYVTRCFGTFDRSKFLNPRPILKELYDYFIVEDLGTLPQENLLNIFPEIRKKSRKLIQIYHDAEPKPADSLFWKFQWDGVICFDERQISPLKSIYPKIDLVPFPCYPIRHGNKILARLNLNLPLRKKIVLVFGQRGYQLLTPETFFENFKEKNFLFLELVHHDNHASIERNRLFELRKGQTLTAKRFDQYLFAADMIILDKNHAARDKGVISSTAFQALGAFCPIIARDSAFFVPFKDEILKFTNEEELQRNILRVSCDKKTRENLRRAATNFVKTHSPRIIAAKLLENCKKN